MRKNATEALIKMLAPMAPRIGESLWNRFAHEKSTAVSIFEAPWPTVSFTEAKHEHAVESVIQVNGKVRWKTSVPHGVSAQDALSILQQHEGWSKWIRDKEVKRVIIVRNGALINLVI